MQAGKLLLDASSPSADAETSIAPDHDLPVVPVRNVGRWIAGGVMLLVMAWFLWGVVTNPNFEWEVVLRYLFAEVVMLGLGLTLWLTAVAMILGTAIGTLVAVMRLSGNPVLRVPASLFLWFFRGTPILVQLIFWFNLALLIPEVSIGIPFGPTIFHGSANDLITPYTAALLGLGLNEGAYMAEIIRAGILSIDPGQQEAARALGMTRGKVLRRIILPQALRVVIPPTGNETIGMLKMTALVSVIGLSDLLYSVQTISSRTFQIIPLLLVACTWYLFLTSLLSVIQGALERRLTRGKAGGARPRRLLTWRGRAPR